MKKITFEWIRTLFAAVLSVSLTVSVLSAFPAARAEETGETSESETEYRYSVDIEFGSMTFCYDYGTWNPSNLRYEAEETESPAAGTVAGFPGWYGFDGIANRISVRYNDKDDNGSDPSHNYLQVTLSYRSLQEKDGVTGITPELYGNESLKNLIETIGENGSVLSVAKGEQISVWLSLKGEPTAKNGGAFTPVNLVPVGMLTIALGGFSQTGGN